MSTMSVRGSRSLSECAQWLKRIAEALERRELSSQPLFEPAERFSNPVLPGPAAPLDAPPEVSCVIPKVHTLMQMPDRSVRCMDLEGRLVAEFEPGLASVLARPVKWGQLESSDLTGPSC